MRRLYMIGSNRFVAEPLLYQQQTFSSFIIPRRKNDNQYQRITLTTIYDNHYHFDHHTRLLNNVNCRQQCLFYSSSSSRRIVYNNNNQIDPILSSQSNSKGSNDDVNSLYIPKHDDDDGSKVLNDEKGKELFVEYINIINQIEQLKKDNEIMKTKQMLKAWNDAEEKEKEYLNKSNSNNKRVGVAVIKTIVKNTNQNQNDSINNQEKEKDILQQKANDILKLSAIQYQYPKALILLGNQLLEQQQQQVNDNAITNQNNEKMLLKAIEYYRLAGQNGNSEGWYNLGHILWTGIPAVDDDEDDDNQSDHNSNDSENIILLKPDRNKAMEAFEKACLLNDPDALYFVGVQLLNHDDDEEHNEENIKLMQKGFKYIEQSASLGHCNALYYVALLYLNGHEKLNIIPCNDNEFQIRLDEACVALSSDALFLRGNCYYHGDNQYIQNYQLALDDFINASELNHSNAAISAGAILFHGINNSIPSNPQYAFQLYQHAGELDNIDGWKNVIACYITGDGVTKSIDMANYISKTMLGMTLDEYAAKANAATN